MIKFPDICSTESLCLVRSLYRTVRTILFETTRTCRTENLGEMKKEAPRQQLFHDSAETILGTRQVRAQLWLAGAVHYPRCVVLLSGRLLVLDPGPRRGQLTHGLAWHMTRDAAPLRRIPRIPPAPPAPTLVGVHYNHRMLVFS